MLLHTYENAIHMRTLYMQYTMTKMMVMMIIKMLMMFEMEKRGYE